jgi:RNA polymerase-interacting CarD/CdnL/TRCF family regulator
MIGRNIICGKLGIGEIKEIVQLEEDGDRYYKVIFPEGKCINYFAVNNTKQYRVVSSKSILNKAITIFKNRFEQNEYSSVQEKITQQQKLLKEEDVLKLAKTLSILNNERELHSQIMKCFKAALKSFADEVMFVLNVGEEEVCSLLEITDKSLFITK